MGKALLERERGELGRIGHARSNGGLRDGKPLDLEVIGNAVAKLIRADERVCRANGVCVLLQVFGQTVIARRSSFDHTVRARVEDDHVATDGQQRTRDRLLEPTVTYAIDIEREIDQS